MSITAKQNLVGHISTSATLIGTCRIGDVPNGAFVTKEDIAEEGSFVQYVNGEFVIEDIVDVMEKEF